MLATLLSFLGTQATQAQAVQDALYIYRNDGSFNGFFYADIDRIEYSCIDTCGVEHNDYVVQEVYALDTLYRIPLSAIDSGTFITPETVYKKDVAHTTHSDLWNYVIGSDSTRMIILAANTPKAMIPRVGDKIVTTDSYTLLPGGFFGRVTNVQNGTKGITVNCETPAFADLFEHWVCKAAVRGSSEEGGARITRGETPFEDEIYLEPVRVDIDLSNLSDFPYALSKQWQLKGNGKLSTGISQTLLERVFLAVRWPLTFNYDCIQRLETNFWFDLDVSGEVAGQFDIQMAKGKTKVKKWIPKTPFFIEADFGLTSSISGKVELGVHRKLTTSAYHMVQYNNSYYDGEVSNHGETFHVLANESNSSFTGTATISVGPYAGVYLSLIDKSIAKAGFRFEAGMKASVTASLDFKDYLIATCPAILPAFMIANPTPLYDALNRDGSLVFGPYYKCDFVAELDEKSTWKNWSYSKTLIDQGDVAKWTGFDTDIKFEGGLVPKFSNTKLRFSNDMVPTASVDISRPAFFYPPVSFSAYYTKSGKQLGSTLWATDVYRADKMKSYELQLPKFGGGKEVRVYPTVKLLRKYEVLGSPFASYTVPAEMIVQPEAIVSAADANKQKFTVADNLDRTEDKYETTATIDFGNGVKPWFTGEWNGTDYVVNISRNDSNANRRADVTFTTFNKDQSIKLEKTVSVTQDFKQAGNASVDITLLEFPAEGGALCFQRFWGDYQWSTVKKSQYANSRLKCGKPSDQDWQSPNRYVNKYYVTMEPNPTAIATKDTIFVYFYNDENEKQPETWFCIPVVVKQAAGPYELNDLAKLFAGSWFSHSGPDNLGEYWDRRVTFSTDGVYTISNRFSKNKGTTWGNWSNPQKWSYTIKDWETDKLYFRVNIVAKRTQDEYPWETVTSNTFVEMYPLFMRSGGFYFDREE